jgi:hypothetical protein
LAQARRASRTVRMTSEGASGAARNLPITSEEAGTGVGHGGARTLHERHVRTRVALGDLLPNTWWASVRAKWTWIWAGSGPNWVLGLKPKL